MLEIDLIDKISVKEHYNEGSSFEGMWNLLQMVKYSNSYLLNKEDDWYSEFLPQSILLPLHMYFITLYLDMTHQ